jgi:choline dehydrogenase-like flavoprotein
MYDSFRDARKLPDGTKIETDLCIIGAGAAGLVLAKQFAGTGLRICILEAGGLSVDPDVDALGFIEDAGREYIPNPKRLRYFGGTTNHWGGQCVPLDPADFEKRDWIAHSGWPYDYKTLEPYYRAAHAEMGLGEFSYDGYAMAGELGMDCFPFDPGLIKTVVARYKRVRFGLDYGDELDSAANVDVILYADVSSIGMADSTSETVEKAEVRSLAGNAFTVNSKFFVLSCGGIENARLLLMSNRQRPAGIGNHSDAVGRYFMDHIFFRSGYIAANTNDTALRFYLDEHPYKDINVRGHLAVPAAKARELGTSMFRTEIEPVSLMYEAARRVRAGNVSARDIASLLTNPVGLGQSVVCRDASPFTAYRIANYFEQTPNPDSRVTLSNDRDALGRPLSKLSWQVSSTDHESIVRIHKVLAQEVGRSGFGRMRVEIDEEPDILLPGCGGGAHHMGTTRMTENPREGVCDGDAKVHYTNNLYIAGSSLFPNAGWVNPTLTIVAVTLKLAAHLKQRFDAEGVL